MNLFNKVACITGSAKRVGKNIAEHLASRGMRIAVHYRSSKSEALYTANELRSYGVEAAIFQADLSSVKQCQKLVSNVINYFGSLDVLVNSASIYEKTLFGKISEKDWERHINTNLKGVFFLSQSAGVHMKKRKLGKIINIIDSDVHHPYNDYLPYMVSKSGLVGLTYCLAKELAPHVQVNGISPGPVLMQDHWGPDIIKSIIDVTPLQKIGRPEDISRAILFALEGTDFMTGAIIPIDGGQHIF